MIKWADIIPFFKQGIDMKHSIKSIFKNLSLFLIFAAVFAALGVFVALDHTTSYKKIDNLTNQKNVAREILELPKENLEFSLMQLQNKTTQLLYDLQSLHTLYEYSFVERVILSNAQEYLADLKTLEGSREDFAKKAHAYFDSTKDEEKKASELAVSFDTYKSHINAIIIKSISYDQAKFRLHQQVTFIAFIVVFIAALWFRQRLALIYKDLEFLNNPHHSAYTPFSQEAESISLKIKRKRASTENPAMLDPVTNINNLKGMMESYSEKKGMKESNYTSVTVFEIDNFSKTNKPYSQELTQSILKKVAFSLSLHQQATDVIARTEYNQFTVILSRPNKEQLFKDAEVIRQSVCELQINIPELGAIEVTLTGGHVIKPKNISLEEAIRQAKKILHHAQKNGKNKIFQVKDVAHSEL